MDNPLSTVLGQDKHDWATKSSKQTITDQLAAFTETTTKTVARQLLDHENIIPSQTLIQTVTQEDRKEVQSKRRDMDERLAAIKRPLLREESLWTPKVATALTIQEQNQDGKGPGKDQALRTLLQAMKAYGEEEEDFHQVWTGESAEESFGPRATNIME